MGMVKTPVVTFALLSIAACFYLYNDLKTFIGEQKIVLSEQIKNQTRTVEVLNQITQRLSDIERKLEEPMTK